MADMLNKYVKFLRGTPSAYEALAEKIKILCILYLV
jgi:hypothetical protein